MRIGATVVVIVLLIGSARGAALQTTQSRFYRIHSDLPADMVDDLAGQLDAAYAEYARRLADFRPKGELKRLEVYLFAQQADYLRHLRGVGAHSAGIFVPEENFLAAYHEGVRREDLRATLRHEAFHQFARNRIGDLPVWLNEGLAQIFEDGYWWGGEFRIGEVPPARCAYLQTVMQQRRLVDFPTLLAMPLPQWNLRGERSREDGTAQYVQAWAMAHMLIFATEGTGEPHYRPYLIDMLRLLNRGVSGDAAFRRAFSDNIDGFQQRFLAYARTLQPDDLAIYRHQQRELAEAIVTLRRQGCRFTTISDLREQLRLRLESSQAPFEIRDGIDRCFRFTGGLTMPPSALHLARNPDGPIPDLVCNPGRGFIIRTRFYVLPNDQTDYEQHLHPGP